MTTTNLISALHDLYATAYDGRFIGFILEDLAEYMGISADECDELIDAAEDEGVLYCDADVYDAADRADWEREQDEELEDWEQYKVDRAMGYQFACC